jgi:biotin carboxylase
MNLPRVGVLFVPKGAAALRDIRRAASGLCQPVLLVPAGVATGNQEIVELASRLFPVSVVPEAGVSAAAAGLGLAGLTTFHDAWLEAVDGALRDLGLPGALPLGNVWDKLYQRQALAKAGLTRLSVQPVDSPDQFVAACRTVGLPAVLKPRRGMSSSGVALIDTAEDAEHQLRQRSHWLELLLETRIRDGRHPSGVENLADFVSVEMASLASGHLPLAVVDKAQVTIIKRTGTDGTDAVYLPANVVPSRVPANIMRELHSYVSRCLTVLGVSWRVTHCEVKLSPDGPEIIEVNGRIAGNVPRLLRLTGGPDLVAIALAVAMGREPAVVPAETHGFAASFQPPFLSAGDQVRSHVTTAQVRALPGVVGVDSIAARGCSRQETDFRMAKVVIFAQSAAEFDEAMAVASREISALYGADA